MLFLIPKGSSDAGSWTPHDEDGGEEDIPDTPESLPPYPSNGEWHSSYITRIFMSICEKAKQSDTVGLLLTADSSLYPHIGTSPSPLIMWSPMGSDSSMQPPSCPPSNEGWPKEEPVKIWLKEEPVDVEMQPSPLNDMPPAPLPDHSMQPPSLSETLFASPETWISSLPSMYARLLVCRKTSDHQA